MALFVLPLVLKSVFSPLAFERLHVHVREQKVLRGLLAVSTLLGSVVAELVPIPSPAFFLALGFVTGTLLYVIVRDHMPDRHTGLLPYFLVGVVLYTLAILASWHLA